MQSDRKYESDRIILITANIICIILCIYNYMSLGEGKSISVLVRTVLPSLLLFVALKYPSMIYSTVLAGIGAFWSVMAIFMLSFMIIIEKSSSLSVHESGFVLFTVLEGMGLICAGISAAKGVALIKKLRDDEKAEEAATGIDQMTKGLTRFLFPRNSGPISMAISMSIVLVTFIRFQIFDGTLDKDIDNMTIVLWAVLVVGIILFVLYIIKNIRRYKSYISDLSQSGVLTQAAFDYYKGKEYCNDSVFLGQKYIFVKGAGRLYEYSGIEEISHSWSDGIKNGYWRLEAKNTDGTEYTLVELSYRHTKENYDNYVLPMLDEIRMINPNIKIGEPGV